MTYMCMEDIATLCLQTIYIRCVYVVLDCCGKYLIAREAQNCILKASHIDPTGDYMGGKKTSDHFMWKGIVNVVKKMV